MKIQIAILTEGMIPVDLPVDLPRIEWLKCHRKGDQQLEFHLNGNIRASLDFQKARFELPNLVGFVVIGSAADCLALQDQWRECFPAVELYFASMPAYDAKTLAESVIAALATGLVQQREFSGKVALDLAIYRREFERLQHSFSRLEEFVSQHALREPIILFEYPATPTKSPAAAKQAGDARVADAGALRVLQILPTDSLGVSGFSIYLRSKFDAGTTLLVQLCAIENEQSFGTWSIGAADLPVGWLQLALSHAIDEPALSLLVMIDLPTGLQQSALAMGQPHPYEEFRARIDGGEICAAPLALRVFGGLPGVRVAGITGAFLPTNTLRPRVTFVLPEIFEDAYQVFPPAEQDRTKFVIYDAASKSITVHPHEGGTMTVARADLAAPVDAWCLSAQICLEHELANSTEFALLTAPFVTKSADAALIENLDESSVWFSGWISLAALERTRISACIPKTKERTLSIYLLTRQAAEASPDFAWARFGSFEFNAAPRTLQRDVMDLSMDGAANLIPATTLANHSSRRDSRASAPSVRIDVGSR